MKLNNNTVTVAKAHLILIYVLIGASLICFGYLLTLKPDTSVYIPSDLLSNIKTIERQIKDIKVTTDSLQKQLNLQKDEAKLYKDLYIKTKKYYEDAKAHIPSYDVHQLDSVIRANSGLPQR